MSSKSKCIACGWSNPSTYALCFNCNAALNREAPVASASNASAANTSSAPKTNPTSKHFDPRTNSSPAEARPTPTVADEFVIPGKLPRVIAAGIDLVVVALMVVPIAIAAIGYAAKGTADFFSWILVAILAAFVALLVPALMDSFSGGSVGRRILNLRVVTHDGARPGVFRSALRHLLKYGLHAVMPLALLIIERLVFGGRTLHGLLTSTHVVDSRASRTQIARALSASESNASLARIAKLFFAVAGVLLVAFVGVVFLQSATAPPNPTRDAVAVLAKSTGSLTTQIENHLYARGTFPNTLGDMGITTPPRGFSSASLNAQSGAVTLVIENHPIVALNGKSIILFPEFKKKKDAGVVKKWRCGSTDIAKENLPYKCKDDISILR